MTNNPGKVRIHIKGIQTMSRRRLLIETIHRGINSEAAMLAGPAADPEAHGYIHQSATSGRIHPGFLDDQRDELHPEYVLRYWHQTIVEHLGHYRSFTVPIDSAAAYINSHLTDLANDDTYPFDDMATEILACHTHLESILSEGERPDKGAPCPSCGGPALVKEWGETEEADLWVCPSAGCHQVWTEHDYRTMIDGIHLEVAKTLTAAQVEAKYRVKAGTLRQWAKRGHVHTIKTAEGVTLYDVADTLTQRDREHGVETG